PVQARSRAAARRGGHLRQEFPARSGPRDPSQTEVKGMSELQEAAKEFLIESHENLDQLDIDLVGLEKSAAPGEALGRIFRTLHTIKGSCSFLGFPNLEAVAHAGENLLGKLRDGKLGLSPPITHALLRMVDAIRGMLAGIESTGHDGNGPDQELIDLLDRLTNSRPVTGTVVAGVPAVPAPGPDAEFELSEDAAAPPTDSGLTTLADTSAVYDSSVRINVDLLDRLMTIAGTHILQSSQRHGHPASKNTCRQLNLTTPELQEHVMKTRLQPLANVWNRFPRLVHDTAAACGKQVRLETEGSETELDKTLL